MSSPPEVMSATIRRSRPASWEMEMPACRIRALRSNTSRLTPSSVSPQEVPFNPGTGSPVPGVDGLEFSHGSVCRRVARRSVSSSPIMEKIYSPGHGSAGPGGVAVFVGNISGPVPLSAVDSIEHGGKKRTPGGFSGLIGCLDDIQTFS